MGLRTLSSGLLRRLHPAPARPRAASSSSPRRRLRDMPAAHLVDHLHTLTSPLAHADVAHLAAGLSADPAKLATLLSFLTSVPQSKPHPDTATHSPRDRYPRAWVAATLLRFGPCPLRRALSERPDLLRALAHVFDAPAGSLSPTLATHVADVLRAMLHEFPRSTAAALASTPLVARLVTHVALQPAADLLPRLVAHRVFSPDPAAPLVPMHKKAIAMLGSAHVQRLLASRFASAAREFGDADDCRKQVLVRVMDNATTAMAEISDRAMCLTRKYEDPHERMDTGYAGNIGIVTAHAYNDARTHMTLLLSPRPVFDLLQVALDDTVHTHALIPALTLISTLLKGFRHVQNAPLPTTRRAVKSIDITPLAEGLADFSAHFAHLLVNDTARPVLGTRRLAVVDMIREMAETLPEEPSLRRLLTEDNDLLINNLLATARRYRRNDVLQVRLGQILCALFSRCEDLTVAILQRGEVLQFLTDHKDNHATKAPLSVLARYDERVRAAGADAKHVDQLTALIASYDKHHEKLHSIELPGMHAVRMHQSSENIKDLNLGETLNADEDYGMELYLNHLLDEASPSKSNSPPLDYSVVESAASISNGWRKGLSGRIKESLAKHLLDDGSGEDSHDR